jgi:hypothetical protein
VYQLKHSSTTTTTVGDGGATRNRLETLRYRLGWPEAGVNQYLGNSAAAAAATKSPKRSLLDGLRGVRSSYGETDEEDTLDI